MRFLAEPCAAAREVEATDRRCSEALQVCASLPRVIHCPVSLWLGDSLNCCPLAPLCLCGRELPLGEGKLEERTLSLSRRPDEVRRRSWAGVGMLGEVRTPGGWRASASNSSSIELESLQIRSYVFTL
jgi:hypothetical protein